MNLGNVLETTVVDPRPKQQIKAAQSSQALALLHPDVSQALAPLVPPYVHEAHAQN